MNKKHFINMGGKEWSKGSMERVYINAEAFNSITGCSLGDSNNKFYYDCKTNALMRSYKNKKPAVEIQY